jgi:5'/3'-nucleotidase
VIRVRVLISNDDGYRAEGLRRLADALRPVAEITIVAPDRNRSGASNSLTLDRPLRVWQEASDMYCTDGTPTDCVHLAITGLLEPEPDMVVSGINEGANLGDDVLYSGTVAAAMEGRFCGLPAIAVSLAGTRPTHFETAARIARMLVERLRSTALPPDTILNVNVPDLPYERLAGMCATRLGHRHRAEPMVPAEDPRGRRIYWVGPAGPEQDAGPGTDFHAVGRGFVSVTPLQTDLTRHGALTQLSTWLDAAQKVGPA